VGFGTLENNCHGAMPFERDGQPPRELAMLELDLDQDVMRLLILDQETGLETIDIGDTWFWWIPPADFDTDGDDELVAHRSLLDSSYDAHDVISVFDIADDTAIEVLRIGSTGAPVGGEQFVEAPVPMWWSGLVNYGVDGERLLLTQGKDDDLLYVWPITDGVVGEPLPPVDCYTSFYRTYVDDLDGDGVDEIALPCGENACVIEALDLLDPDPESWTCFESRFPFGSGDFDGDGEDDFLLASQAGPGQTDLLTAVSGASLAILGIIELPPALQYSDAQAIDDLDGDDRAEIALLHEAIYKVYVLTDPVFDGDASEPGPVHTLSTELVGSINEGLYTLEWNGSPGRDLVHGLGIALSPAGCALGEAEQ
jgi:hypothetical protein